MEINKRDILDVIEKIDSFIIPHYQRNYTWDLKIIKELISDLDNFYDERNKNKELFSSGYFIGSILLKKSSRFSESILVDGQQRITTMLLFVAALWWSLEVLLDDKKINEDTKNRLITRKTECKDILKSHYATKGKLFRIENENEISKILKLKVNPKTLKGTTFYFKNFKYIYDYLITKKIEDRIEYIKILKSLVIGLITLDEIENEYHIFESINSKGKQLTPHDLIKNYIIMNIDLNIFPNDRDKADHMWGKINFYLEKVDNNSKTKNISAFWRQLIALKTGNLANMSGKNLYIEFKKEYKVMTVESIKEIIKHMKIWLILKEIKEDNKSPWNAKFYNKESIVYFNCFFLNYYTIAHASVCRNINIDIDDNLDIFESQLSKKQESNIKYVFAYLSKLVIARAIVDYGRVEGNRTYAKMGHDLFNDDNVDFMESLQKKFISEIEESPLNYQMPTKEIVFSKLSESPMYKKYSSVVKWTLLAIENHLNPTYPLNVDVDGETQYEDLTIEHYFPQNPTTTLGPEGEILQTKVNTFPNLTIIKSKLNSSMGNKDAKTKANKIKRFDYFTINKENGKFCEEWNEISYEKRKQWIWKKINDIWFSNPSDRKYVKSKKINELLLYSKIPGSNDEDISIIYNNGKINVKKGTTFSQAANSSTKNKKHVANKILQLSQNENIYIIGDVNSYSVEFLDDVTLDNLNDLNSLVQGGSTSVFEKWKDEEGTKLKDILSIYR